MYESCVEWTNVGLNVGSACVARLSRLWLVIHVSTSPSNSRAGHRQQLVGGANTNTETTSEGSTDARRTETRTQRSGNSVVERPAEHSVPMGFNVPSADAHSERARQRQSTSAPPQLVFARATTKTKPSLGDQHTRHREISC